MYINWSWVATLLCLVITTRTATAFLKDDARLFTAMALFALVWALLLPYYSSAAPSSELFVAFGGYLLVYSAFIVLRDYATKTQNVAPAVTNIEWISLTCLGILITGVSLPSGPRIVINLPQPKCEAIVGTILDLIGYGTIYYTAITITKQPAQNPRPRKLQIPLTVLAVTIVIYSIGEIWYTVRFLIDAVPIMTGTLRALFAFCKVILTILYSAGVVWHGRSPADQGINTFGLIRKFFGLPR